MVEMVDITSFFVYFLIMFRRDSREMGMGSRIREDINIQATKIRKESLINPLHRMKRYFACFITAGEATGLRGEGVISGSTIISIPLLVDINLFSSSISTFSIAVL